MRLIIGPAEIPPWIPPPAGVARGGGTHGLGGGGAGLEGRRELLHGQARRPPPEPPPPPRRRGAAPPAPVPARRGSGQKKILSSTVGARGFHLNALYRNFEDLVQLQAEECVMYEQRITDVEERCREAEIDKERYLRELTEQQAEIQDLARAQAEDLQQPSREGGCMHDG